MYFNVWTLEWFLYLFHMRSMSIIEKTEKSLTLTLSIPHQHHARRTVTQDAHGLVHTHVRTAPVVLLTLILIWGRGRQNQRQWQVHLTQITMVQVLSRKMYYNSIQFFYPQLTSAWGHYIILFFSYYGFFFSLWVTPQQFTIQLLI